MNLRYYQINIANKIIESLSKGYKRFTVFMPVGTGRTITILNTIVATCKNKSLNNVLFICENKMAAAQAHSFFNHNFANEKIHIDFVNWHKIYKNKAEEVGDYYDVIVLQDIPPACRKCLSFKLKDSNIITLSISSGPYTVKTQYHPNEDVSLFVAKDRKKRFIMFKEPGIYLIQTKNLLDVQDIRDASEEDILEIKETIANDLDYFVSYSQLVQDGFIQQFTDERDSLKKKILELEKREKELLALIAKEGNVHD